MLIPLGIYLTLLAAGLIGAGFLLGRKRVGLALFSLACTPLALVGWYHALRVDALAAMVYPSDTVYAADFSREKFAAISLGTKSDDLLRRLGEPLRRTASPKGLEYWHYSQAGQRSQNYWNFVVVVDGSSHAVAERFSEFYTD